MNEEVGAQRIEPEDAFLGCKHVLPVHERQFFASEGKGAQSSTWRAWLHELSKSARVNSAYAASKAGRHRLQSFHRIAYVKKASA